MLKETFHNKIQPQRDQHFKARKDALQLTDQIPNWKDREREIKKIAKSKFIYAIKSKKQQQLENSLMAVKTQLPENI